MLGKIRIFKLTKPSESIIINASLIMLNGFKPIHGPNSIFLFYSIIFHNVCELIFDSVPTYKDFVTSFTVTVSDA